MTTLDENYKEELIQQAKQDALVDLEELQKKMGELIERIFHFAFEEGYKAGYAEKELHIQEAEEAS